MKIKSFFALILILFITTTSWSQGIRKPVCAGRFYSAKANILSNEISLWLEKANPTAPKEDIKAIIVPHAGHAYSAHVAAYAYKLIQGKDYESVIIIGPSHYFGFQGCSIYTHGGYETPLGIVPIDESLAKEISRASGYKYIPQAHQKEHSIEVQVPFVQKTLPKAKIVPIIMGYPQKKTIYTLSNALQKTLKNKNALIVVSTDLSHFYHKKKANDIDRKTISIVEELKVETLIRKLEQRENIMCGGGPVAAMLLYAKNQEQALVKALHYADSSATGGPESQVVGYFAAAVYFQSSHLEFFLSDEEKDELLHIARSAIYSFISEGKVVDCTSENARLLVKRGAFVTLKKHGRLRGCIGYLDPILPLCQTVIQASIYAATKDVRFNSVSLDELNDLEIEISVLSPLKKINNPRSIIVGKHGLLICKGDKRGVLLPQVPVENHWNRETFLQQACQKAGLSRNAWRHGADIFIFEAIVFQ